MTLLENIKKVTIVACYTTLFLLIIARLFNIPVMSTTPFSAYFLLILAAYQVYMTFQEKEKLTIYEYSLVFCSISLIAITM